MRQAWQQGFDAGTKRRAGASCFRCFTAGVLLALTLLWTWASAQPLPPAATKHKHALTKASRSVWGMEAPVATLGAQLMVESGFRPDAVSQAGAQGLAQFMPRTAADLARQYPQLAPVNAFSVEWAMRAQSLLMRDLVRQFTPHGRDACNVWCYATAAYNGGPRWVLDRIELSDRPKMCFATQRINPGIRSSAQRENEEYPIRVLIDWEPRFVEAGWGPGQCGSYTRGQ